MSDAVTRVAKVISRRVGLHTGASTRPRLARCLSDAAAARGLDVDRYAARCEHDRTALQDLLDLFTVQESAFFRDPVQFSALATEVLPLLEDPVTLWSAGCGNGQEPFSLAMILAESGRTGWRVVATDISERALARTASGWYGPAELRGLSAQRQAAFGAPSGGGWQVGPALRDHIVLARHNVAVEPPPLEAAGATVVFCRNVLIYLGRSEVVGFMDRLASWLPPDGVLFLGYAESLWHLTERFRLHRLGSAFVYRPAGWRGGTGTADPAPAAASMPPERDDLPSTLAAGEAALAAGDVQTAVQAFTRAAAQDPDSTVTQLQLGLALELQGERRRARRAFQAARAALRRSPVATVEATLEGYEAAALEALLDEKLGGA